MPRIRAFRSILTVLFIGLGGRCVAEAPRVQGQWERIGPFPILRVWGTPQEMGFAHGYLLAEQIYAYTCPRLDADGPDAIARFEGLRRQLLSRIKIDEHTRMELGAIVEGVVARLGDEAFVEPLDRHLSIDDLIVHNAGDLLRAFGCSGFTVWGEKAGKWDVITTRNFDYPVPGKPGIDTQMILVRNPSGDRAAVATVTWPGYIGAFTGVNEHGVCTFMHDGTGGRNNEVEAPVAPVALTLTTLLETSGAASAHSKAAALMQSGGAYPFSYMIRVVSPVADGEPASPEWVFRVDPSGVSRNPVGTQKCITTNHYLESNLQPVPGANDWSLTRYQRLENRLTATVDPEYAWAAQASVASSDQGFPTAHTIVVYPTKRRIDVGFATWDGNVVPATESKSTTIMFDELFR